MRLRSVNVLAFYAPLLLACAVWLFVSGDLLADSLTKSEPPSPVLSSKSWKEVQAAQLTFLDRLKEYGVTIEIADGETFDTKFVPGFVTIKSAIINADELSFIAEFGFSHITQCSRCL